MPCVLHRKPCAMVAEYLPPAAKIWNFVVSRLSNRSNGRKNNSEMDVEMDLNPPRNNKDNTCLCAFVANLQRRLLK